jgi:hypothetical protein
MFFGSFNGDISYDCTGTTLLLIATDAYNRYVDATGAVLDSATGLLRITEAQYANLQSLFFSVNGVNIPTSFYQNVTDDVPVCVTSGDL